MKRKNVLVRLGGCILLSTFLFISIISFAQNRTDNTIMETMESSTTIQNSQGAFPKIKFDRDDLTYDIGNIEQSNEGSVTIKFENVGNADLQITKVKAGCSCTAVLLSNDIIVPGESGEIKATLTAGGNQGFMKKAILIETNDPDNKVITVFIKANIIIEFALEPYFVSFGQVTKGNIKVKKMIKVIGKDTSKYQIKDVGSKDRYIKAEILPPESDETGQRIALTLSGEIPIGPYRGSVVVHTDHPKHNTIIVVINAIVSGHIQAKPDRIFFRLIHGHDPKEKIITVTNTRKKDFKIVSIAIEPDTSIKKSAESKIPITNLDASKDDLDIKMLGPDTFGNQKISVRFKRDLKPGEHVRGSIVLTTDDVDQKTVSIYYNAFAQP